MKKVKHFIQTRKILSVIIILMVAVAIYWVYAKSTSVAGQTSYVVGKAQVRNIVTTVTGTGQVYASSQQDIKSKVSGDIVYLNKEANGQRIKKGTLIAQIDSSNAEISLESARIAYQKLIQPADAPTILQAQNSLSNSMTANAKSYDDAFSSIVGTFTDLPNVMSGLNDMLYSRTGYLQTENVRTVGQTALDLQTKAGISYDNANAQYTIALNQYKSLSRNDASSTIESFTNSAYQLEKKVSEAIKNTQNALDYVRSQKNDTAGNTAATSITSWSNTINSDLNSLLSAKNTIDSTLADINQNSANLLKLKDGATELDIAAQDLNLRQAENTYADYFIRAPFDGVLARISVKSTDTVSGGTVIGTIVSDNKVADITLNEVDVANVHVGQDVTLTFDAIDGLVATGTVSSVDLVGTVSQGVVNYNVEISINTLDSRIKSGMSISASIIVGSKENVLAVPNSAIKTQGRSNYVQVFNPPLTVNSTNASSTRSFSLTGIPSAVPPIQKTVEIGISNDTFTEIISGLNEGDQIVIRTIAGTATSATAPNIFSAATSGARNSTASGVRIPRGN